MKEGIPFSIFSNRFYLECYISYGNIWDLHHRVGWLAHCEYVHGICIHCCLTFIEKNSGSRSVQQLNNGNKYFLKLNWIIFKVSNCCAYLVCGPNSADELTQPRRISWCVRQACSLSISNSLQGPEFESHVETGLRICLHWLLADCLFPLSGAPLPPEETDTALCLGNILAILSYI